MMFLLQPERSAPMNAPRVIKRNASRVVGLRNNFYLSEGIRIIEVLIIVLFFSQASSHQSFCSASTYIHFTKGNKKLHLRRVSNHGKELLRNLCRVRSLSARFQQVTKWHQSCFVPDLGSTIRRLGICPSVFSVGVYLMNSFIGASGLP